MNQDKWENTKKPRRWLRWALLAVALGLMVGLTCLALPWMNMLQEESTRVQFQGWIQSLGAGGWLVMLLIQIGQIIVAFLPGEPVEVLAGVLYGTWGGLLICEVGILLGSATVFFLVKRFGKKFLHLFIKEEELQKFSFLQDSTKLEALTFLLFFIPGTPKDALTYLMPFTAIRPMRFLFLSMLARIPSVISSTWAGATLSQGNLGGTVAIFIGIGIVGLGGIYFQKKFLERQQKANPPE